MGLLLFNAVLSQFYYLRSSIRNYRNTRNLHQLLVVLKI